jgi:hypothetical protein
VRSRRLRCAVLALGVATVGCGGGDGEPLAPDGPAPARRLEARSGSGQVAGRGQTLGASFVVAAVDQAGTGVAGVTITWAVTQGGGTLDQVSPVTDEHGEAAARLTTGALGAQVVTAGAEGLDGSPVTFTATAIAGAPVLVAAVPIPPNYGIHDTFVRDGLAFVSAWDSGLMIFDVGNGVAGGTPSSPQLVGSVVTAASGLNGARVHNAWWFHNPVSGERRYVFVGQEGPGSLGVGSSGDIHVVDASDLRAPVEVAQYRMPAAGTHNFWMDESAQILYAAYYNGGVVALDVSGQLSGDLASREIARIQPGGPGNTFVWGVQLHPDGSLYASDMLSGLWRLSLSGGAWQVLGGGNNVPERYGSDLWVHGAVAYTGTWGSRFVAGQSHPGNAVKVWRLSGAPAPRLVDSVIVAGIETVSDVEVSVDGRLLMLSAEGSTGAGVHFYALVPDPEHPLFLASHSVPNGVHTATLADIGGRRYAFLAQDPPGPALLILDLTDVSP